ncbi:MULTISPECIES: FAD-binding oxidoreductase [Halorussus]|uniref:NAD(P)/FAD-dependent oxidoreductase n=1 Tax=Halorussus TaxID=1070314 RepID=UPI000E2159C1|nr:MULTISPECIES: FAD-dependent oxidoreductase [Halorussus]NHN59635.1 FAD-binding oxidoreductase [Halorussus sp. JP-T4]
MYDAAVVGGGIVGSSVAYHLARAGAETALVDREDEGRATDAGAGILSPATSSRTGSDPWFAFAVEAVDYYSDLVAALADEQDGETGYDECGLLSVAVDDAEVEAFDRAMERIDRRRETLGRPDPDSFAAVDPGEARERFPPLADVQRAAYYEDAARVDGKLLTAALRRAGEAHGLEIRRASAEELRVEDGEIAAVVTGGEAIETAAAVVAGGAWSPAFGDQLGVELPVEPQRGQIAHLDVAAGADPTDADAEADEPDTGDWPIVSAFRDHYLVSWPDGRVAAGATRETGSGFAPRTTAAGVREVLDEALRVAPGLADAEPAEVRVGLRPVSEDRLPILGGVPGVEGAFVATGHGATGLQLGPYSGKCVAERVLGREPETDISAFDPARFE